MPVLRGAVAVFRACRVVPQFRLDRAEMICEWFARCTNPAAGTVAHPILGAVPCCTRCANKLDLTFMEES